MAAGVSFKRVAFIQEAGLCDGLTVIVVSGDSRIFGRKNVVLKDGCLFLRGSGGLTSKIL
jgi:hypothetical protein